MPVGTQNPTQMQTPSPIIMGADPHSTGAYYDPLRNVWVRRDGGTMTHKPEWDQYITMSEWKKDPTFVSWFSTIFPKLNFDQYAQAQGGSGMAQLYGLYKKYPTRPSKANCPSWDSRWMGGHAI